MSNNNFLDQIVKSKKNIPGPDKYANIDQWVDESKKNKR